MAGPLAGVIGPTNWNEALEIITYGSPEQQELAAIIKKIGDKQTFSTGLYELYRITQLYPKVDLLSQLQNTSEAFRTYIRDGIAQMEKYVAAGRTPSSVPMPTLPSCALNLPSPKYQHLSPVHTNSLNDVKSVNTKSEPTNISPPHLHMLKMIGRMGGRIGLIFVFLLAASLACDARDLTVTSKNEVSMVSVLRSHVEKRTVLGKVGKNDNM